MTTNETPTQPGKKLVTVNNAQTLEQARFKLKTLTGQQHELAETREEVLIGRESLDRKGKEVRLQRDRTAGAEVAFMNALREYYNTTGASFPADIDAAYSAVDAERNQLGLLETEHLEAEEDLGAREWTLMDQENELYQYDLQQLLTEEHEDDQRGTSPAARLPSKEHSEAVQPSPEVQYQAATMERNRLMERFMHLRTLVANIIDASTLNVDEAELLELGTLDFATSFSDLLSQIAVCEVRIQHLQAGRDNSNSTSLHQGHPSSEPSPMTRESVTSFDALSRARSEPALPDRIDHIPILHRIKKWLLDCLKQNVVEKAQYLSMLQHTLGHLENMGSGFSDWEMLVTQTWSCDSETDLTEAAQPVKIVPFSGQWTIRDDVSPNETMKDDDLWSGSSGMSSDQQYFHYDSSELLLGDLCTSAIAPESPLSALRGSNEDVDPLRAVSDVQCKDLSSRDNISKQQQFVRASTCERDTTNPLVNLALVPESDTRRDSVQDCLPRASHIVEPPLHTSCTQKRPEKGFLWAAQDFSHCMTQDHVTILPMPDIVYSPMEWSADLQCFYVFGLAADDNVAEVFWSRDSFVSVHDVGVVDPKTQTERDKCTTDDRSNNDLFRNYSVRCPWFDFWSFHAGHLDSRYCGISDLEQPRFFIAGRVFSTMRLVARPLTPYKRHWFQFCFVVVQNNGHFSQCLSIQPSCGCQVHLPYLTGDRGIAHTSEDPPPPYPWEKLSKNPLRVRSVNGETLPAFSRICYDREYPVEHNFPVLEVGSVVAQGSDRFSFRYTLSSSSEGFTHLNGTSGNISELT